MVKILKAAQKHVRSLTVTGDWMTKSPGFSNHIKSLDFPTFDRLIYLEMKAMHFVHLLHSAPKFPALRFMEIGDVHPVRFRAEFDALREVLEQNCSLLGLRLYNHHRDKEPPGDSEPYDPFGDELRVEYGYMSMNRVSPREPSRDPSEELIMPPSLEWLHVDGLIPSTRINVSRCSHLIGVKVSAMKREQIVFADAEHDAIVDCLLSDNDGFDHDSIGGMYHSEYTINYGGVGGGVGGGILGAYGGNVGDNGGARSGTDALSERTQPRAIFVGHSSRPYDFADLDSMYNLR